jgi:hypothetical protein
LGQFLTKKRFRGSKQLFEHSIALYFEAKGEKSKKSPFLTFTPKSQIPKISEVPENFELNFQPL